MIVHEEIGKIVQKRDIFMAIINTEDNIKNLELYREISRKLTGPRKLTNEETKKLTQQGKIVLLVTCNIYSTEIASAQMSLELAYKLVSKKCFGKDIKSPK